MRRTRLERRDSALRQMSAKRARANRERRAVVMAMADEPDGQVCARCHAARAVDTHELLSRARGGSITDPANMRPLCRPCHTWITEHPLLAGKTGWALSRGTQ